MSQRLIEQDITKSYANPFIIHIIVNAVLSILRF